jgi:hypothetical protein
VVTSIQMMLIYLVASSALWIVFFLLTQWFTSIKDRKIPFLPAMILAWWGIVVWAQYFV